MTTLLAYPNVSEGRDRGSIDAIATAFGDQLLDVHSDPDHNRSAYTLAGEPGELAAAVAAGASRALELLTLDSHDGVHPRVGIVDVAAIVYLQERDRGAACAEALVLADMLSHEHELPVFLYGILAGGRTRAELRKGGPAELARRIQAGELEPDFGPPRIHPRAGATLVGARPPLVAFNVELVPGATVDDARAIAGLIREGGDEGLPGVRAIGLWLESRGWPRCRPTSKTTSRPRWRPSSKRSRVTPGRQVPSSWVSRRARPSMAFRPRLPLRGYRTIEDALAARAQRVSCNTRWHRPSESAAPSIVATPPGRSRPAVAPAARRVPRSERRRSAPSARQAPGHAADLEERLHPRRAGVRVHVPVPARDLARQCARGADLRRVRVRALRPVWLLPRAVHVAPADAKEGSQK